MAGGFSSEDAPISEINVTPLVDVVLVLLIIFLITAPVIYQSAIKVQLPSAKSGEEAPKSPLNFILTKEGELYWDQDKIEWPALGQRLQALGPNMGEQTAIISADRDTSHGTVIQLMDALRKAGLMRFALNVEGQAAAQKKK